jgi:SAM-dependent methyltransferase
MTDHQHSAGHQHQASPAEPDMTELLDLDAEVLHAYLAEVMDLVHDRAGDPPPRRILDLGSGTGTGTLALLRRFDGAEVTAVDMSAHGLQHLLAKARALAVADRIHTVEADLDAGLPDVGTVDLVWASASLHHMADPGRVLAEVFAALRPGGLLAVAELSSFPRFLPDDIGLGTPGLEARIQALLAQARAEALPHMGSDWGPLLSKAGFTVEPERTFAIDLAAPLPAAAGRYAQVSLGRMRSRLADGLSIEDLSTLDTLLTGEGPDSLLRRDDLVVRTERSVWIAARP